MKTEEPADSEPIIQNPPKPWWAKGWLLDRLSELAYTTISINALAFLFSLGLFGYVAVFVPQRGLTDLLLLVGAMGSLYTGRREWAKFMDLKFGDATSYEAAASNPTTTEGGK